MNVIQTNVAASNAIYCAAVLAAIACAPPPIATAYESPVQSIRVGILSKFAPERLEIVLKGGRIFANGVTIALAEAPLDVRKGAGSQEIQTSRSKGAPDEICKSPMRVKLRLIRNRAGPSAIGVRIDGGAFRTPKQIQTDSMVIDSDAAYEIRISSGVVAGAGLIRRRYAGRLEIAAGDTLAAVVHIPLESYVRATARAELGPLLSAQLAIEQRDVLQSAMETVVSSYALAHPGRHDRRHDERNRRSSNARGDSPAVAAADLCDLTHCMHFPGLGSEAQSDREGAGPRRGASRLVMLNPKARQTKASELPSRAIVPAYFHSTCGGRLASPSEFWADESRPELSGLFREGEDVLDSTPLCSASPHFRWRARFTASDLRRILPGLGAAEAVNWEPLRRAAGRVVFVRAGRKGELPAHRLLSRAGRAFGWNTIKSNDFVVEPSGDSLELRGRGLGHGIGLCQWGAREQARLGRSAVEILKFYYPGARLVRLKKERLR